MRTTVILSCLTCLMAAAPALAQAPARQSESPCQLSVGDELNVSAAKSGQIEAGHWQYTGAAEMQPACSDVKFSADVIDVYPDRNRIEAHGNVVFTNPEGRIAADSIEFDMNTGLGTFHDATGLMSLGPKADPKQFGNQDPDVYFWGEVIEKKGQQKYHITNGGFTTCVQPTPRWGVWSASVDLNLHDYAIARNTVLRVKGVPLLYLPLIYYPIQDDQRATGFLLPTYGTSTLRGQAISNAFFWAINRSQDATFFHDWFTRTGQGAGVEYRYVASAQSNGTIRYYLLNQKQSTFNVNNAVTTLAENRSYEVLGNVTEVLSPTWRARARVDWVSNILTQQLYNQNVARASNPMRAIDANLSGAWRGVSTNASFQRTETFQTPTSSFVYGGTPRLTASIAPRQLFGVPVYAGLTSEYAYLPYQQTQNGAVLIDRSLTRVDLSPTARVPLSTLSFLTVNSSETYRTTYYSRRSDAANPGGNFLDEGLTRRYLALRSNVIGPVLTKIWDTPNSSLSQRMKHVIEPTLTIDYFTDISNFQSTPVLSDTTDRVIGGMAQYTYGLNNRLFYRSRPTEGSRGVTREFLTIGLQQTYYTKPLASQTDIQYNISPQLRTPVSFSPIALTARFSPTPRIDANSRIEYDATHGNGLQVFSVGSTLSALGTNTNVTFNRTRPTDAVPPSSFLSASTNLNFRQSRLRSQYALSWDVERGYIVSQRLTQSYLAQCCGFEVEFQNFNFAPGSGFPIPSDRRVNFSFILAGLGTFSNFFGAFGGVR